MTPPLFEPQFPYLEKGEYNPPYKAAVRMEKHTHVTRPGVSGSVASTVFPALKPCSSPPGSSQRSSVPHSGEPQAQRMISPSWQLHGGQLSVPSQLRAQMPKITCLIDPPPGLPPLFSETWTPRFREAWTPERGHTAKRWPKATPTPSLAHLAPSYQTSCHCHHIPLSGPGGAG